MYKARGLLDFSGSIVLILHSYFKARYVFPFCTLKHIDVYLLWRILAV